MKAAKPFFSLALTCLVLGGSSCSLPQAQPDLTRFYILTAKAAGNAPVAAERPNVLLRGINVPEFLRGRLLVVRAGANQVSFIDEARWAEPLEAGLQRVIAEDLASAGLRVVPRGSEEHAFEIAIWVKSCEGVATTGAARLAAKIEIFRVGLDATLVAQDDFVTEVAGWDGKNYGELAAKLSEAAAELSARTAKLLPES